jgi:hypothetical protein
MFKLSYMKIVTQNAVSCFRNGGNAKFNNTEVVTENGVSKMYLFGNLIATLEHNVGGVMKITNADWRSNTTKERLNGLPNVRINQAKGVWYLNGVEWNGAWKQIN